MGRNLTALSGRFNVHDLLKFIVDPKSRSIRRRHIATIQGEVVTGRIVNLKEGSLMINTDMLNPNAQTTVKQADIEVMKTATKSMMPPSLLDSFTKEEILDLMAYLLSRGNPDHEMFQKN